MNPEEGWYADPLALRWWDGTAWSDLLRNVGDPASSGSVADPNGSPAAGWYPDPFTERWWNGAEWTESTRATDGQEPDEGGDTDELTTQGEHATTIAPEPGERSKQTVALAVIAGTALALAITAAVFLLLRTGRHSDTGDTSAQAATPITTASSVTTTIDDQRVPPAGAVPTLVTSGKLAPSPSQTINVTSASCAALLSAVAGDQCVSMTRTGGVFALTLTSDSRGAELAAFAFTDGPTGVTADQQLVAYQFPSAMEPGSAVKFTAVTVGTGDAAVLALISDTGGGDSTIEFIAPGVDGVLRTAAVLPGGSFTIGSQGRTLLVAAGVDPRDPSASAPGFLHVLYPSDESWSVQTTSEPIVDATARVQDSIAPSAQASVVVEALNPDSVPLETLAPTGPSGLISGSALNCDGSFITIVASRPLAEVNRALAANPESLAVKNADACASLNPSFSTGSNAGEPIYVIFYGPFFDRFRAQEECVSRGKLSKQACFVAPLTDDPADRSVRYGPYD